MTIVCEPDESTPTSSVRAADKGIDNVQTGKAAGTAADAAVDTVGDAVDGIVDGIAPAVDEATASTAQTSSEATETETPAGEPPAAEAAGPLGKVVTVFSAKGGTGKTVVSTNLAVAL